ncbi:UpxY family transcription antiterminator [Flavobacteriaceae bacterium]|nr:UpxY family transcription antiterminator [Flavobacteriaceae bacterium]
MESWHVIYTKPRAEKKVEQRLNDFGISAYCPVKKEIKQWSDRKKKILVPVLPSMVLVNIDEKQRNKVFDIPGVVRYMFWLGKHATVKEEEVDSLKKLLTQNNIDSQDTIALKVGEKIDVPGFENQNGIIKKISNNQIWVVLKKLGYVIKLKIA